MAKRTTIDLPAAASVLGAAQGAGFDTQNIVHAAADVVIRGGSANAVVAQVLSEGEDVVDNFTQDPLGTSMDVAIGAMVPIGMAKVLGWGCDAFGIPKAKSFGKKLRIKWAI